MAKFLVTIEYTTTDTYENYIEAETKEKAKELALNELSKQLNDSVNVEYMSADKISE